MAPLKTTEMHIVGTLNRCTSGGFLLKVGGKKEFSIKIHPNLLTTLCGHAFPPVIQKLQPTEQSGQ
jgi:hypothetical protein